MANDQVSIELPLGELNTTGSTISLTVMLKSASIETYDVRCGNCGSRLFRVTMPLGIPLVKIEIKCHRCSSIVAWPQSVEALTV